MGLCPKHEQTCIQPKTQGNPCWISETLSLPPLGYSSPQIIVGLAISNSDFYLFNSVRLHNSLTSPSSHHILDVAPRQRLWGVKAHFICPLFLSHHGPIVCCPMSKNGGFCILFNFLVTGCFCHHYFLLLLFFPSLLFSIMFYSLSFQLCPFVQLFLLVALEITLRLLISLFEINVVLPHVCKNITVT